MISMLQKEACSGSIHDLAFQTQIAWQHHKGLSQRGAVQTGKMLDVDIHPDFRTRMEHKAFLSTWCKTFLHTREKEVFFLNTLKISLVQTLQEGPLQVMFVENSSYQDKKELNTRKHESQDTAKMTSASADSHIKFSRKIEPFWVRTLCVCLVLTTIFLSVSLFSPCLVIMSSFAPSGCPQNS